jgi:hypothetical protein
VLITLPSSVPPDVRETTMESEQSRTQQAEICDRNSLLSLAVESYIFGFASVEMYRTMYQLAGSQSVGKRDYVFNKFFHSRRRATADEFWLAAPNSEILYSNAWLDLSTSPLLLDVPDMGSRYYVLQFLDYFANAFAYVGTRTFGNSSRSLAIVGPAWSGSFPDDIAVVRSPTNFAWIFGRISIQGDHEFDEVHGLQDRLELSSRIVSSEPAPCREPWPPFRNSDKLDFFSNLDQVLRRNAPPAEDTQLIRRLPQLGMLRDNSFEPTNVDESLRGILEQAITLGRDRICARESQFEEFCPGWIWEGSSAGRPGRDNLSRAASAKAGLGILAPEEAIYPFAYVDNYDEPLEGSRSYRLTFGPEEWPKASYSWSMTVYELPYYRLVKNPINRYSWNSARAQESTGCNSHGSLSLQATRPKDLTSYWLPTPRTGKFALALRVFGPSDAFLRGKHLLPRIMRLFSEEGIRSSADSHSRALS